MKEFGREDLKLEDYISVVFEGAPLNIADNVFDRVDKSHAFLSKFIENKVIYGVNTGFGPMAPYKINDSDRYDLQVNLIKSHSSGMGKPLDPIYVKSSMLARLNTLALGYSGVHRSVIDVLQKLINHDITPLIFEHGGVGASGDLVQLAHLGLVLIGEGEVFYQGERQKTCEVFKKLDIQPIQIKIREGLAIMNGTSVMTGIGIVNTVHAQRLIKWSVTASSMICEIVGAYDDYFSKELNQSKKHRGQQEVAAMIRSNVAGSKHIRKRDQHLYGNSNDLQGVIDDKVQEYYSIRCVPQIVGTILETVDECMHLLFEEVNSANDNPIVDVENQNVLHGGNFHGDYVSFEMDKLKIAITKLSMLAERQLNYLLNPNLNNLLPPFVNLGILGLNFGIQGMQFTATSTTAENQTLSNPMYVHSIPNNNDNQDIVSMGTNAALITKKVVDNTFEVLAIELITIVQAIDHLNKVDGLSEQLKKVYFNLRKIVPKFEKDYPIYKDLGRVKAHLFEHNP
ncbi:aromatic amino acid ammonia-lyase [Flammeovirgaceae bacterium SG7u.111]|nr:aromatic amino acid ammonia-lyase [Flammeovirgaceae bacterium SG7u.132]WPO36169.1 aromatic amino acid ammonia-lyase [Flammeovirgaceae bacterium SG7u.111]